MALVGNKADLQEKREVPTQVSQLFIVIRSFLSAEYFLIHFLCSYMIEGWH